MIRNEGGGLLSVSFRPIMLSRRESISQLPTHLPRIPSQPIGIDIIKPKAQRPTSMKLHEGKFLTRIPNRKCDRLKPLKNEAAEVLFQQELMAQSILMIFLVREFKIANAISDEIDFCSEIRGLDKTSSPEDIHRICCNITNRSDTVLTLSLFLLAMNELMDFNCSISRHVHRFEP